MIRSLFTSVSGMMNSQTRMDIIGNNLANANTVAFKTNTAAVATAFDDLSRSPSTTQPTGLTVGLGSQVVGTVRQFTQGALQRTDVQTDLAVQGNGFFSVAQIQDPANPALAATDGRFVTRAGNFVRDSLGYLRTMNGMFVLGTTYDATQPYAAPAGPAAGGTAGFPPALVRVPPTIDLGGGSIVATSNFSIGQNGEVNAVGTDGVTRVVAFIPLMAYSNPNGLKERGGNLYEVTAASGSNQFFRANSDGLGFVQSGALELSNVDMAREFSEMIIVQRAFEANARTISASDEMLQTVTNMKR